MERLLVLSTKGKESCECVCQDGCTVHDSCQCCSVGIPIKEAINKVAFALMESGLDECDCKECAKVAINTLLGRKIKQKKNKKGGDSIFSAWSVSDYWEDKNEKISVNSNY